MGGSGVGGRGRWVVGRVCLKIKNKSILAPSVPGPNLSLNLSRSVLATLWRDKLHETFHSATYPATAKIVARQVA